MYKRYGLKWLNFLYSFFGFEVFVKSFIVYGTLSSIITAHRYDSFANPIFTVANMLSVCFVMLISVEIVFKLLACIKSRKKEGYELMIWALALGPVSTSFFLLTDQGLLAGFITIILELSLFVINYRYVRNRKHFYGNPDLL